MWDKAWGLVTRLQRGAGKIRKSFNCFSLPQKPTVFFCKKRWYLHLPTDPCSFALILWNKITCRLPKTMVLWQLHIPFFMFLFTLCVGGVCWHWWVDRYRWFLSRKHIMTVLAFPPYNTNIVKQPLVVQYLIYYIFSIDNHFDEIWNHLKTNKHHGWPVEKHLMVMVKTQQNHCITFGTNASHGRKNHYPTAKKYDHFSSL